MTISFTNSVAVQGRARSLAPLCIGAGTYLLLLFTGDNLLHDPDTFWQIKVGRWILDHHAVPQTDFYSLTRFGEAWISTSWLSQVLFAAVYSQWGWAGPVILTALAVAATAAVLVALLERQFEPVHTLLFALLALALSAHHLLARPHVLAMPVMVVWSGALMAAADRGRYPSLLLLPLMALWANLHGGFVLGLALIGPIGLEALWRTAPERRFGLALRWVAFGFGALAASCCTPYGWNTLLGAARILDLGELFNVIAEWRPADFSSFSVFEGALLGLVGLAFFRGLVLSPPRILLVLVLTWMALTHVRSIEAFGFLLPLVLARPLGSRTNGKDAASTHERERAPASSWLSALAAMTVVLAASISTSIYAAHHVFRFSTNKMPVAAVDLLVESKAERIFNSYGFGGYLIARDIKPFVDGRTELYGEKFLLDFFAAEDARNVDGLLRMLDEYKIDATLLTADAPAAQVLDHIQGWRRAYTDGVAIVHVRAER
jgi:predicted secreted protein